MPNSPEMQYLIDRVRGEVPDLTGPVSNVWEDRDNDYLRIDITFEQEAPTEELRKFRPGYYSLALEYNSSGPTGGWDIKDYGKGRWYIAATESDDELL